MDEELITVSEAARRLGVHRSSLSARARSGALPATRAGRSWIVRWSDVLACADLPTPTPQRGIRRTPNGTP